jgi:hypothetical protein
MTRSRRHPRRWHSPACERINRCRYWAKRPARGHTERQPGRSAPPRVSTELLQVNEVPLNKNPQAGHESSPLRAARQNHPWGVYPVRTAGDRIGIIKSIRASKMLENRPNPQIMPEICPAASARLGANTTAFGSIFPPAKCENANNSVAPSQSR